MPLYRYLARTKTGDKEQDTMMAPTERDVAEAVRAKGLTVLSIKPSRPRINPETLVEFLQPVKLIDKITFIKNLSVMLKAGLPVARALKILADQTTNKKFTRVIADLAKSVEAGTALADAMGKYPRVFPSIFVNMVSAGEVSGNLEKNLIYLAEQMQRDYDLMAKAKGALTYPIVVLIALGIVGFLMFTFVLPKLTSTFKDLNVELPFMTKVVIAVVDVFARYGIGILMLVAGMVVGFFYWRRTSSGKKIVHKVVLYLPVFGGIVKKINLARFVRTFSSLIKSGMPIVEALDISSHVVGNVYYQKVIADAASKVKVGSPLAQGFKKYPKLFSGLVVEMMQVGEESGTTEQVLGEVASFYEAEVDQTMKNLSSILEPLLMMVIGTVVGILAIALVTPIYSITQNIG